MLRAGSWFPANGPDIFRIDGKLPGDLGIQNTNTGNQCLLLLPEISDLLSQLHKVRDGLRFLVFQGRQGSLGICPFTDEQTKIVAYVFRHPPVLAGLEPGVLCNMYITAWPFIRRRTTSSANIAAWTANQGRFSGFPSDSKARMIASFLALLWARKAAMRLNHSFCEISSSFTVGMRRSTCRRRSRQPRGGSPSSVRLSLVCRNSWPALGSCFLVAMCMPPLLYSTDSAYILPTL